MITFSDLTLLQRRLLVAGAALVGAGLIALLAASDFDLSVLRTLRVERTGGNGTLLETRYNPVGLLGLVAVGVAVLALMALLVVWLMPLLLRLGKGQRRLTQNGQQVAQARKELERELTHVLGLIRGHITTNESYARSLANAQLRLGGLSEAEQVRVIVSLLVAENERMRQDTGSLKTKLEESKKQVETLRESLTQAEQIVLKDPLTGTGNRRCFDVTIERAILDSKQKKTPLSLVMCDIDHFKRVNDAFGHQVGDEIIKMFARVIEAGVREGDTVIRYGGEEFAIILPMAEIEAAKGIADRVRRQFGSKKLTIRETSQKIGQLTASFGVAQFRPGDDANTLVQRADAKLYDAKAAGRNRVVAFGNDS